MRWLCAGIVHSVLRCNSLSLGVRVESGFYNYMSGDAENHIKSIVLWLLLVRDTIMLNTQRDWFGRDDSENHKLVVPKMPPHSLYGTLVHSLQ